MTSPDGVSAFFIFPSATIDIGKGLSPLSNFGMYDLSGGVLPRLKGVSFNFFHVFEVWLYRYQFITRLGKST